MRAAETERIVEISVVRSHIPWFDGEPASVRGCATSLQMM